MAENRFAKFAPPGNRFSQFSTPQISPEQAARRDELLRKRAELDAELELTTIGGTAGSIGKALDDNVRLAANGISMGFLDKSLGAEDRAKTNAARERQGIIGMVSEGLGAAAVPMGAAKAGLTVANIPMRGAMLAAPTIEGAAYGALNALGNDKDVRSGAAWGAGLGMLGQAAGAGINKGYSAFANRSAPVPSSQLREAADAAYAQADNSGLVFSPEAFGKTIDDVTATAQERGVGGTLAKLTDKLYPKASAVTSSLDEMRGTAPSLKDVAMLKRITADAGQGFDADASLNSKMAGSFRDMIRNAAPSDFIAGNVDEGIGAITKADDQWAKMLKTQRLEKAMESAKDRVGANYTQAGLLTALRQEVKAIKRAKDFKTSWTPEEKKLITQVVRGGAGENIARLAGLFAPRGPVTGAVLGATAYANPMAGAALTGAGMGGRAVATKLGMNRFADLQNVAQGGSSMPKLTPQQQENIRIILKTLMSGATAAAVNAN